jgi:hypothetical protein
MLRADDISIDNQKCVRRKLSQKLLILTALESHTISDNFMFQTILLKKPLQYS